MQKVNDPNSVLADQIKVRCEQSCGACHEAFDLYTLVRGGYAMKFNVSTLHIEVFGRGENAYIQFHYDRFNFGVAPAQHILVDTIWNDFLRKPPKLFGY